MRRFAKTTIGVFATALAAALCAAAPAPAATTHSAKITRTAADAPSPAYFEMTDYSGKPFIVKMTDAEDIDHARALLDGSTDQMPHILGRIVKRSAPYNPRWSFHLDPRSVTFFDVAIEVCDSSIPYLEDHLDEAGGPFLPGSYWCDWSSRLVREVPAP